MKKLLVGLFALTLITGLNSCKKDDDDCNLSTSALAGTYKLSSIKYKMTASSAEQDITLNEFDACDLDNLFIFAGNGTYAYQPSGVACSPESDTFTGTWSLNGNSMLIDGEIANVSSFKCNSFAFTLSDWDVPGDRVTYNFNRQ